MIVTFYLRCPGLVGGAPCGTLHVAKCDHFIDDDLFEWLRLCIPCQAKKSILPSE